MNFLLKDESSLWLFLRNDLSPDTDTAVVRITKESNSQRCFIGLGTYIKDKHNKSIFKIFTRQQLVDFNSKYL